MAIDPKQTEEWRSILAEATQGLREEGDPRALAMVAAVAVPALLAEREEMLAAIREAVELTQRPGLDTSARWALEDLAAFLPAGPRGGRLTEALSVLRKMEWASERRYMRGAVRVQFCPACRSDQAAGHTADCRLASLLR